MKSYLKIKKNERLISICQGLCLAFIVGILFNYAPINPAMAQPEQVLRTLSVTGQGVERIPATLAEISLGVEVQGKTAEEVQQEVARRTTAVVEFLRERNVERLQTQGINLQPRYNYNDDRRSLIGYVGTNTVSFRIPIEEAGSLLDRAVQAGATRIDSVSFTATEAEIASAEQEALRKATVEAQQKAHTVLEALNFSSREIIGIQINGARTPQPRIIQRERMASLSAADATTPVIGGQQAITSSVTLQIRY